MSPTIRSSAALLVRWLLLAACAVTAVACGSGPTGHVARGDGQERGFVEPGLATASRSLVLVLRAEPASLAGTILIPTGITTSTQRRIFNAGLTHQDERENRLPYLAETLPSLNTDSWLVFPDGRMETTYQLRPNATWQDSGPLSAEDFVFAWRVYATPEFGISTSDTIRAIAEVTAPDSRTIVIRWRQPNPKAGELTASNLAALPRHLLERVYNAERESFATHPFWTAEYVGAGPYRLGRWEPGAFIEADAFGGHVLGRPKIDRVRLLFMGDPNTVLANLLSENAHVPVDDSIRVQQGIILKREWSERNGGTVLYRPTLWRWVQIQHRSEYAVPRAVLDLRVRKALAHTIDKQAINDALFEGEGILSDSLIPPIVPYWEMLERALAKYPFDPQRAEQLMTEAGYTRGQDRFYATATEGRPSFELRVIASAQNDAERAIMARTWRRAGFEIEEAAFHPSQAQDGQLLGTFRSLSTTSGSGGEDALTQFMSTRISAPVNRWIGSNRGGWANPDYDRIVETFRTTLDRQERDRYAVQAARVLSEQLGVLPLYFNPAVLAHPSGLRGVNVGSSNVEVSWNIHEWEFRS